MDDDVVAEILSRLPAKAVLRCRAVCRSWRRITTTAYFVAAHSRRRPLQLLGYTGLAVESSSPPPPYNYVFTRNTSGADGVLICNPATRQLVNLPPANAADSGRWKRLRPSAFYFHRPSGEHLVLCYRNGDNYILSISSGGESRRLGPVPDHQQRVCSYFCVKFGVTVGDTVYWGRRQTDDRSQMMAFDTVSETFRRVAPPPPVSHADEGPMFDMHGALALTAMSTEPYMDVWITAEDAASGANWVRLLRVELPPGHYSDELKPHGFGKAVLDDAGVLLVAMTGFPSFLYDTKGRRMASCSHRINGFLWLFSYRESLLKVKTSQANSIIG
uniref:F-box domain-containing protein n=1 Tax=Oryza punctata TaxID=4537 RepID=A0A0E0JV45_ORYPU